MEKRKRTVLALGMVVILVGMAFATAPMNTVADDPTIVPPTVDKWVSPTDICFGSINTKTTVTIEVTGAGTTSETPVPLDVVFAIDSSGSMRYWTGSQWAGNDVDGLRRDAAVNFLEMMDPDIDQAGVVSWDGYDLDPIDFAFGLSDDFDDTDGVEYWINQVDDYGGTILDGGLARSIQMLDDNTRTEESVEVIIFLTDGIGTYTYSGNPGAPVDDAADAGYVIYSIGLGSGAASGPLIDMADATGGSYYSSPSAENLDEIYDAILEEIITSTQPHDVQVVEVTESYITGHSDFSHTPDSITTVGGKTVITWNNIGQYAGDLDNILDDEESVTLTFKVGADKPGYHLGVQDYGNAVVNYNNADGEPAGTVLIPQAYINVAYSTDLIADGGDEYLDVGDVIIWQDATNLYVKYVTDSGWYMTETHLHVSDVLANIPQTKKNNPQIGKFMENDVHSPPTDEVLYTFEWTWAAKAKLYIAAHAVVQKEVESLIECEPPVYRVETAWGEGTDFGGASWAMYIEYQDP